jgi:uncharacterized protein (TIGR02246 family)
MKTIAYLVCVASLAGLAFAQESRKATSAARAVSSADEAAIRAVHETYRRTALEGAWSQWAATFADDAVFMPPNSPAITGRAAIEKWGRALPRMAELQNPIVEIDGGGDVAVTRGNYTLRFVIPGQSDLADAGKFMVTWRKQRDGAWKFHRGIFNSDLPPPAASGGPTWSAPVGGGPGGGDPWVGVWVLNADKTRINPGPKVRSETRTYTTTGGDEVATYDTVDGEGKKLFSISTYKFDGKDAPIVGDLHEDTMALTRAGSRAITAVIKKGGKVVRTAKREVSADGQVLTVEFKGTNARGNPIIEEVWVFDRKTMLSASEVAITAVKSAVTRHWSAINNKDSATVNAQHVVGQSVFLADAEPRLTLNSPAWLAMVRRWEGSKVNWSIRDLEVQPLGNTAVATFYLDGSLTSPDGVVDSRPRRVTEVWINADGAWKEAHHHDSVFVPSGRSNTAQ